MDAPAQGPPPPTWVADSSLKSSEAPAGLVTPVTTTVGQFPKDQDLRFSHGTTHSPSIPFWGRPVYLGNGYSPLARDKRESTERDSLDRKHKKCWIQKKTNVLEHEIMIPDFSACWTSCPAGGSAWTWGQFVSSVSVYWRTSICYSWSLALFCLINEFMWIEFTSNSQAELQGRDTQLWKAIVIVSPLKQMIVKSAAVPSSYLSVFSTTWSLSALVSELTRDVTGSSKNLSGHIESIDFSDKNTVGLRFPLRTIPRWLACASFLMPATLEWFWRRQQMWPEFLLRLQQCTCVGRSFSFTKNAIVSLSVSCNTHPLKTPTLV